MSGGSFNYLCYKETDEIVYEIPMLESMEEALIEHGYEDIAKDTRRLIEYIKCSRIRIGTLNEMLKPAFKAVEWYESADYSKDTMIKALEEYRKSN